MKALPETEAAQSATVIVPPLEMGAPLREAIREAAMICGLDPPESAVAEGVDRPSLVVRENMDPADSGHCPIVILDAAERAAAWAAKSRGLGELDALVFTSGYLASAIEAERSGRARIYWSEAFLADPRGMLRNLFQEIGLFIEPVALSSLCDRFAAHVGVARRISWTNESMKVASEALALLPNAGRPGSDRAWWGRMLFEDGGRPSEPCPAHIDVTGKARILAFGPFISLTPGDWRATLELELSPDAARRSYLAEFRSGESLSRLRFGPLSPGANAVSITHRFEVAAPAEIRLWVARAAFHGELAFKGAAIEPAPAAA
jgi:hypothetical protein